ncbi:MAG: hypothetical protein MUF45_10530 [Spirosomaceae bacterium]|nr:hypothetical protein [Spirosomataceae bacterium]
MKRIVIVVFYFIVPLLGFGQKTYQIKLESEQVKQSKTTIKIDSVIDNRLFTHCVGTAQVGLNNKKVPALLENDLNTIRDYFYQQYTPNTEAFPITLIIDHFWVSEQTRSLTVDGVFELELSFARKNSKGELEIIHQFNDEITETCMDATKTHSRRIKTLLDRAFKEFLEKDFTNLTGEVFAKKELNKTKNILKADTMRVGFYKSFADFYNNTPRSIENISISALNKKNVLFKMIDNTSSKRIKNYFGYCDGENIYINAFAYGQTVSNYYAKVLSVGKYLLLDDTYIDPVTSAVAVNFGLLGGLVAASTAKRGIVIDIETGLSIVLSEKSFKAILKDHEDYLQRYEKMNNDYFDVKKAYISSINKAYIEGLKNK